MTSTGTARCHAVAHARLGAATLTHTHTHAPLPPAATSRAEIRRSAGGDDGQRSAGVVAVGVNTGIIDLSPPPAAAPAAPAVVAISPQEKQAKAEEAKAATQAAATKKAAEKAADDAAYKARLEPWMNQMPTIHPPTQTPSPASLLRPPNRYYHRLAHTR